MAVVGEVGERASRLYNDALASYSRCHKPRTLSAYSSTNVMKDIDLSACILYYSNIYSMIGMSGQLLVRLTKQNSSREMYSPIRRNTRNN